MTLLQAIILGVIQGITEFLPVSSSGHLIFIPQFLGWQDQGIAFDIFVHLGTLFAVAVYFRKRIWTLIRSFLPSSVLSSSISSNKEARQDRKLALWVLFSIIPAAVIGLMFEQVSRSAQVVAWSLIVWGVVLAIADWVHSKKVQTTPFNKLKVSQVIFISLAQAIALIPGTSRSGITITAGLFSGLSKKAAAEFSFLMSLPVIGAAGLLKLLELISSPEAISWVPMLVGGLTAALSGFLAISFLMKLVEKRGFLPFAIYRVIVGVLILLVLV